jgi:hypothetical protein
MTNDYLWDRSGTPDLDIQRLEELLAPLAHDAPLDELRLAKGRRSELVRATAQEPVEAPASGRAKGKMNLFDKRIIGAATLTTAALGLLGVGAYKRHTNSHSPPPWQPPMIELATSFAMTPHALPVAPATGADLAITAGESAKIHVPFGAVDVEIQSKCSNAEVEMSVVTWMGHQQLPRPGDPPRQVLSAILRQVRGEWPPMAAGPASGSHALGGDPIVAGTVSSDGRTSTYRLVPEFRPLGMVQYTSRCVGQSPMHGVLEIDREDGHGQIGTITNARVFDDANDLATTEYAFTHGIHVFGSVLPGATVSISGKLVDLEPPEPGSHDEPLVAQAFRIDAQISADHPIVAVRVDDANGTHFYVSRRTMVGTGLASCTTKMIEPKQTAAKLEAQGDHAGALRTLKSVMAACEPDRDTFSLALEYACKAGDVEAARAYWSKLPPELQHTLEPMCTQHSITRDQLGTR